MTHHVLGDERESGDRLGHCPWQSDGLLLLISHKPLHVWPEKVKHP